MPFSGRIFAEQDKEGALEALNRLIDEKGRRLISGIERHIYFLFGEFSHDPDPRDPVADVDIAVAADLVKILQYALNPPLERSTANLARTEAAFAKMGGPVGEALGQQIAEQRDNFLAVAAQLKPLSKTQQEDVRTVISYLQKHLSQGRSVAA